MTGGYWDSGPISYGEKPMQQFQPMRRIDPDTLPAARTSDLLQSYDQLGPLARKAVQESPRELLPVGRMIAEAGIHVRDINTGMLDDEKLAAWIRRTIDSRMRDRGFAKPAQWCHLEPRNAAATRRQR